MIYAEILAAGRGFRMDKKNIPKQFIKLGSKPIFMYSLETFLHIKEIDKIIICVPFDWVNFTKVTISKYIKDFSKIEIVIGGKTRNETLFNGINQIKDKYGLNNKDIIITHDAARPFITETIIKEHIKKITKVSAVTTVIEATDTIIELSSNNIKRIPDRVNICHEQTPQTFNIKKLLELYNDLSYKEKTNLTDATKIFLLNNEKISLVKGDFYNFKITRPLDLEIADYLIKTNFFK
ncbi:MAG: 2-C-methyl-D-erythritol 4-phosphate cytidylyltransferase [Bacilli bacterium]|nr:2-C-methyl-D-erythritol 4-phosphate cytidylyltransferase [Bacilli bacterium]